MRVFACLVSILIGLLTAAISPAPLLQAVENGIDLHGNDIGMVQVGPGDIAACSARCDEDVRCLAFTLYTPPPADKGFCWLKHTVGQRRAGEHVISGLRRSTSTPQGASPSPIVSQSSAAPGPAPAAAPVDCSTSHRGCEHAILAHMPGYSAQVGHTWRSGGAWTNRIILYSRSWGPFTRPVRVCGRSLFAGPDQLNKTVEGWLNPRSGALATRFSLYDAARDVEVCDWRPGGRGGSLG